VGVFDKLRFASRVAQKDWSSGGWDGIFPPFWSVPTGTTFSGIGNLSGNESIENNFEGYVEAAYKRNGPIFSCVCARQMVFSQARFQYRRFEKGHAGDLFGDDSLKLLEQPWPGGTTGELLAHMEQDASLAGNSWWTKTDDAGRHGNAANGEGLRIVRLRPDWVTMVIGTTRGGIEADPNSIDAKVLQILYRPPNGEEVRLLPTEVAHYSPIPDPLARYRGMSWITPIIREIEADNGATTHKKSFFENAAVPNMVVKFDKETDEDDFDAFVAKFKSGHEGAWNAYKTLFLMGGADVTPLTHDFRQMEFNQTVGKGESRIASAAGVPPTWVGFSEGLQGSGLNAGNFAAARRRFADGTIRPLWQIAAASLSVLLDVPHAAHLWYDERDIAFLREDELDRAEIFRVDMNAVDAGIKAGFEPDAVVEATRDRDLGKLVGNHTGLVSVQMQPPLEVRDPVREASRDAELQQIQAMVIQTLTTAGATLDSATEAVLTGDFKKLKQAPLPEPTLGAGGGGVAGRSASGATPPKKPGQTSTGKPTGPKRPGVQSSQQTDKPEKEPRERNNDSSNSGK